ARRSPPRRAPRRVPRPRSHPPSLFPTRPDCPDRQPRPTDRPTTVILAREESRRRVVGTAEMLRQAQHDQRGRAAAAAPRLPDPPTPHFVLADLPTRRLADSVQPTMEGGGGRRARGKGSNAVADNGAAPTWALVIVILLWATAQYGLAVWTLRDLARRADVAGGSKTAWALGLLALPVIGPLAYVAMHPVPAPGWLVRLPERAHRVRLWLAQAIARAVAEFDRLRRLPPPRWLERPPRWTVPPRAPRDRDVSPPSGGR